MAEGIRVLVIDTDSMGGQLMASALKRCRDHFDVSGPAGSLEEAMQLAGSSKPHVAILSMELQNSSENASLVLHKLRQTHPRTAVVVLHRSLDREIVVQSFRAGARGVISRNDSFKALSKCIRAVHVGQVWASTREMNYLLEALARYRTSMVSSAGELLLLTKREKQVTQLVGDGLSNRAIAEMLQITEHTVSNYLYRIFDKIGVSNRVQLILYTLSRRTPGPESAGAPSFEEESERKTA